MKAICLTHRERIEIREVAGPRPGPGQVAVEPEYVGLCGTDLHVFLGQCEDRVAYPAVLGHEAGGRIAEVGRGVDSFSRGDRVVIDPVVPCGECPLCRAGRFNVCLNINVLGIDSPGALAERVVVDARNIHHLPDAIDPRHAPMVELYTVAVHALRITRVEPGDVIVVLGAGRLGLSLLDMLGRCGAARIISVDVLDARLAVAKRLGAGVTLNARDADPVAEVMTLTAGLGADKVIEAVGHAVGVPGRKPPMYMAVQMVRPAGQITAMGQGGSEEPFFWRTFVLKEATIVSSRLNLGDMPRALARMAGGLLHPREIITHVIGPGDVARGFQMMRDEPDSAIKVVVDLTGFRASG